MVRNSTWMRVARTDALMQQRGRCLYCKMPLSCANATADHKRPRKRGGRDTKDNIAAACRSCNEIKAHMWETKFWHAIKGSEPPSKPDLMLVWASRRIWRRTHKACERIEARAR